MSKAKALIRHLIYGFCIFILLCAVSGVQADPTADQKATSLGWRLKGTTPAGKDYEVVALENDRPVYYITLNADAAISTGADLLHSPPLSLDGSGFVVGLWDIGDVNAGHQELLGRVTLVDANLASNHASLVAGTIAAQGIDPDAKGMAPAVNIDSYDWHNDIAEMLGRAATGQSQEGKIYISNHSYGYITGWQSGSFAIPAGDLNHDGIVNFLDYAMLVNFWDQNEPSVDITGPGDSFIGFDDLKVMAENWLVSGNDASYWFGVWPEKEDRNFGRYGAATSNWDSICYNAPYLLPFKALGNDRSDNKPNNGEDFWYIDPNGRWQQAVYDDVNDPRSDNWDNSGFDTIPTISTAKNIMTVGAVNDAVTTGQRDSAKATMTTFSGWGPTDDGRIKPDIVANGTSLYSCTADANNPYDTYSGTSAAAASAAGSATLLMQHYADLFPGKAMLASTLKGLIIHTATDIGNLGPDYSYGWGLMDVNTAAQYITADANNSTGKNIIEDSLATGSINKYTFTSDGSMPIIATLCWTDPQGTPVEPNEGNIDVNDGILDNNTPMLVNDLDLRIIDSNNIVFSPYILDPNNPAAAATTGDNILDNVEQIYIAGPNLGTYTIQITHKASLTNSLQNYSLIINQPIPFRYIYVDDDGPDDPWPPGDPTVSDPNEDGSPEHPFDAIQKAVDDVNPTETAIIVVRDGDYVGIGNYDISTKGLALKIKSEMGPANCVIDCQQLGRAFIFETGESAMTVIQGLTIINGYPVADPCSGFGGAVYCSDSSPLIRNCTITDNIAEHSGGAIFCDANATPIIIECDISFNSCGQQTPPDLEIQLGGGIYCKDSSPAIVDSSITYNLAYGCGGGIASVNSDIFIANSYISYNDAWVDSDSNDYPQHGGGIYSYQGRPIISGCLISGNDAVWSGGGIAIFAGAEIDANNTILNPADTNDIAWIGNCDIFDNACWASGGGVYCSGDKAFLTIENSLITDNWGYWSGGISSNHGGLTAIANCTITNNVVSYPYLVGGLECYFGDAAVINSIIWANRGIEISGIQDGNNPTDANYASITYSDVAMVDSNRLPDLISIWPGTGNINTDPLFANAQPNQSDYHLKTKQTNGRYNPLTGNFDLTDTVTSPCINTGDPKSDYSFEPAPNGGRINMGTYGNTNQASKSP
ncbi:MAG: S8 family serine peptidase [Planctomycetota bacterium]|jgi:predicted outer membrane repeat protein